MFCCLIKNVYNTSYRKTSEWVFEKLAKNLFKKTKFKLKAKVGQNTLSHKII